VTQHRVQNFCWYELPVKWITGPDGHARVAASLARAFDLLQMPRYAAICRSATTRDILAAYQTGTGKGKAAFRRAVTKSGITPPDLPGLTWGAGEPDISWAISRTANLCRALDLLTPGSDWPDRRYQLTPIGTATALEALRAHATGPRTLT